MRYLFYSFVLLATLLPVFVYGQAKVYSPLVTGLGNEAGGFEQYINFLYGASISIAALLAVVKIIIAGAKYMLSDVITNKGEAIKDIQGAILGLLLILGAVVILEFINPQLVKRDIQFQTIPDAPKPTINSRTSVTAVVSPDGAVIIEGAGRDANGNLLKAVFVNNDLTCYGNWCPSMQYVTFTGNIFSYNLDKHCTDSVKNGSQFTKEVCIVGITSALTTKDISTWGNIVDNSYYGFCATNGSKTPSISGDVLSCELPTRKESSSYFEKKYNDAQKDRTTEDIATNGLSKAYDDEDDYRAGCKAEGGTFVQIESDGGVDEEASSYRCVWYR